MLASRRRGRQPNLARRAAWKRGVRGPALAAWLGRARGPRWRAGRPRDGPAVGRRREEPLAAARGDVPLHRASQVQRRTEWGGLRLHARDLLEAVDVVGHLAQALG